MQTRSRSRNSMPVKAKALNVLLLDVFDAAPAGMSRVEKVAEVRTFTDAALKKCDPDSVVLCFAAALTCIVIAIICIIETTLYNMYSRENDYYHNEHVKEEIRGFMFYCGVMLIMFCAAISKSWSNSK